MELIICVIALAPVRKEPAHRSELVNQLLFGEVGEILEVKEEWIRIRSLYDDYEGWLTHQFVDPYKVNLYYSDTLWIASELSNAVRLNGSYIHAPMGSSLTGFNETTKNLWDEKYIYEGTYRKADLPFDSDLMYATMQKWINAPYLWGGRSFMGVDCSGFVQVLFKLQGVRLKRDANQQACQGRSVLNLKDAIAGDLAFFQNEQGRIVHVGIIWNKNQIVHASGKVRIDNLDEEGIIHMVNGKRTHQLSCIRRIIGEV